MFWKKKSDSQTAHRAKSNLIPYARNQGSAAEISLGGYARIWDARLR